VAGRLKYQNNGYLYTFALDASRPGPAFEKRNYTLPEPPAAMAAELAQRGLSVYHANCMRCHGPFAQSINMMPDLRQSASLHSDLFERIVFDGVLGNRGMPGYADLLGKDAVMAIKAYVIDRAREGYAMQQQPPATNDSRDRN
jgi:mono/diheme cytochrome c family protein